MFDNLLFQPAGTQLANDLRNGTMPNALLFSGCVSAGKLTCALELARVLSCTGHPAGQWTCSCPSCLKHKALVSTSLLVAGPRSCTLEVAAASKAFLEAVGSGASHVNATRYLFIRSVRKLTLRFSPVLWEGDDKSSKISPLVSGIDELLEELDPVRPLPEYSRLEKICASIQPLCSKLEGGFMYDSIPVSHIRRASSWAHFRSDSGKKVMIIENADRMQESVRNALLKVLEEPPEDVVFVLTTTRRGAVMPTILSRVRTYSFVERTAEAQSEVVRRVFHCSPPEGEYPAVIDAYLQTFLPVEPSVCAAAGRDFVLAVAAGRPVDVDGISKLCGGFEPRLLLNVFLNGITAAMRSSVVGSCDGTEQTVAASSRARVAECAAESVAAVHRCLNHVTVYNQSIASALELLAADLSLVLKKYEGSLII